MCALEVDIDKNITTGLPVENRLESCPILYQIPENYQSYTLTSEAGNNVCRATSRMTTALDYFSLRKTK